MIDLDDLAQIQEAIATYCWTTDDGDAEGWANVWTDDGELHGATPEPLVGRAALMAMVKGMEQQFGGAMRHLYSNLVCEYAGGGKDEVQAKYYNYVAQYGDSPGAPGMALCRAHFVRQGGRWRMKTNKIKLLFGTPPG